MLVPGNQKIHKSVWCFSLPPIDTCPNCSDCKDNCYAKRCYNVYVNCRIRWDDNLLLTKLKSFVSDMVKEIKDANAKTVRIHVGGDFYSEQYIRSWVDIVFLSPNTMFYGYSKVFKKLPILNRLNAMSNVNIINSILPDGCINFGSIGYVQRKASEFNIHICPVTAGKKGFTCGDNCKQCLTSKYMLFVKH